jgi:glutamate synthase (NADPH/NADH) large chain
MLTPAKMLIPPTVRPVGLTPLRRPRNHLTTVVSNLVMETVAAGEQNVAFEDDRVTPVDRALGTHLAGALARYRHRWNWAPGHAGVGGQHESWRQPVSGARHRSLTSSSVEGAYLRFYASSVPGNGLGAFSSEPISITVEGGAQDGVAKGLSQGRVAILKGYNHDGVRIDGSVGKGLGYGATGGLIIVQGNADSRACIRLSGADVIIGGDITEPLDDSLGYLGARANIKGFLCEYMTAGRVLVLGDPGPWICAGMTDGVLYLHLQPEMKLDRAAIQRRIARGANVDLKPVDENDRRNLDDLLSAYAEELTRNQQTQEARQTLALLHNWQETFVKVVPIRDVGTADSISS